MQSGRYVHITNDRGARLDFGCGGSLRLNQPSYPSESSSPFFTVTTHSRFGESAVKAEIASSLYVSSLSQWNRSNLVFRP
jgi:hypothetical protein